MKHGGQALRYFASTGVFAMLAAATTVSAYYYFDSDAEPQMDTRVGWKIDPVFTVGESLGGYTPPGILDGIGAFKGRYSVAMLVDHELGADVGYPYRLGNGVEMIGARVTRFDMDPRKRVITKAGLAYDRVYDRYGDIVVHPSQVNELVDDPHVHDEAADINGFNRFCSAQGVARGTRGFYDDIFFSNEETSVEFGHPHGGSVWATDVYRRDLWALPDLGRGTWENLTALNPPRRGTVALLLGDDFQGAPLYLYVGRTNRRSRNFVNRNGLEGGKLYVWVSDSGERSPEDFAGTGNSLSGHFVEIAAKEEGMAGMPGYDDQGYKDDVTLRDEATGVPTKGLPTDLGAFSFSRPEDLATNPFDGHQAVMASTGRAGLYPSDTWGTLYVIDVDFSDMRNIRADLTILLDDDDSQFRDFGVRSPDNLDWAYNGKIYVNEDRSTSRRVPKDPAGCDAEPTEEDRLACLDEAFGGRSKVDASIWEIDPASANGNVADIVRIAVMNRDAELPDDQTDGDPLDIGDWESSGVLDVTKYFKTTHGERLLIANTQAHAVRDGSIESENLVQGGQLFFLSKGGKTAAKRPWWARLWD